MDQQVDNIKIMADKERNEKHKSYLNMMEIQTEGVKNIIPGVNFQLHLLMLFLWRGKQNQYFSFRLASELKEAEKFDDVVFQYQQSQDDKLRLRLVQVKHITSAKNENITQKALLSKDNDNFSLQKYFHSFLKMKRTCAEKSMYSIFFDSEMEDVLICTNIDLDPRIKLNECSEKVDLAGDKILKLNKELKAKYPDAAIYMFKYIENNDLINKIKGILSETSDFWKLINELVECCTNNQVETHKENQSNSKQNTDLIINYYYALIKHVFSIERVCSDNNNKSKKKKIEYCVKFLPEFIDGKEDSSIEIRQFRKELVEKINNKFPNDNTTNILKTVKFCFADIIFKMFKPEPNPQIENMINFVDKINNIIDKSDNKVIKISDNDSEFVDNFRKLSGYILITKFKKTHFSTNFLDGLNLLGNLNEFRTKLKELLGDEKFCSLYEYDIEIDDKEFKTCEEGALDRKLPILPGETEVQEFFSKFKIIVNYPNADDIDNVIREEMKDLFKRLNVNENKSFYMEKLYKWLEDSKAPLFTMENTNTLFNDISRNINNTEMAGGTKSYFDKIMKEYEEYSFIEYKPITNFLQNTETQILHLSFDDLNLGCVRVVQTFQYLMNKKDAGISKMDKYILEAGKIFIKLPQLEQNVVDCFNDNEFNNLLMIECDKNIEIALTNQLLNILRNNKHKKIIFITQKIHKLSEQITNFINYNFEVDKSNFSDLDETSQNQILDKEIIFQGQKFTLEKLLGEKLTEYIDSEVLSELIKNNDITIDCNKSANLDEIRGYFIDRKYDLDINKEINKKINFRQRQILDFFVITNVSEDEIQNLTGYWYEYKNSILYQIFCFQLLMLFEIHRRKLIGIESSLETTDFETIHYSFKINEIQKHYVLTPFIRSNQSFMHFDNKIYFTDHCNEIIYENHLYYELEKLYLKYSNLQDEVLENVVFMIYTNIRFSSEMLSSDKIVQVDLKEIDEILEFEKNVKDKSISKNYRLIFDYQNNEYNDLLKYSKTFTLALALNRCVFDTLVTDHKIVTKYLWQLDKEIINFTHKRFYSNFIRNENLSDAARNLREQFLNFVQNRLQNSECIMNIDEVWKIVEEKLSKQNDLPNILNAINSNPKFVDLNAFTKTFIKVLHIGSHDKNTKIILDRTILGNNLDNLAVHILVLNNIADDTFKFSSNFLDSNSKLPDNLQNFRTLLIEELQQKSIILSEMKNYVFEIEDFVTCEDKNERLPNDLHSVSEFLNKLVFRVEQPNDCELIDIVDDKLGYSFFSCESMTDHILNPRWINKKNNILLKYDSEKRLNKIKQNHFTPICLSKTSHLIPSYDYFYVKVTDSEEQQMLNIVFIKLILSHDNEINYDYFSKFFNLLDIFNLYRDLERLYKYKDHIEYLIVIVTHLGFDFKILELHNIHLEKVNDMDDMDDILDMGNGFRLCFDKQNKIYEDLMRGTLIYRQAKYLVSCICEKNVIRREELNGLLLLEVIDIENESLHCDFVNNKIMCKFNKIFREHFINLYRNFIDDPKSSEDELCKKLEVVKLLLCTELKSLLNDGTIQFIREVVLNDEGITIKHIDSNKYDHTLIINVEFFDESAHRKSYIIATDVLERLTTLGFPKDLKELIEMRCKLINLVYEDVADFLTKLLFVQVPLEYKNATRKIKYESLRFDFSLTNLDNINKENMSENQNKENLPIQYIWSKDPNPQGLTQLFENYLKHNVVLHHLKKENGKYIWQASQGSLSNLRCCISENTQEFKSNEIIDRVVIIAAEPGMGKSTLLKYLAEKMKDSCPNKWVIKVDLINCDKHLNEHDGKFYNLDQILNFLYSILGLKNVLETKFLRFQLEKHGNIILLFDGFDEIDANNRQKIITLLQALNKYKVEKMWLTTRLHFKIMVEDELQRLSYNLKPFTDDNQTNFLKSFWMKTYNLHMSNVAEAPLNNYIMKLVGSFKEATNQNERIFLGIPLQNKLLAEAFQENFWEYYNATLQNKEIDFTFPKITNLHNLYRRFIDAKYEIYFKIKTKPQLPKFKEKILYKGYTKLHRYIAFKLFFRRIQFLKEPKINTEERDELIQIGIVQSQNSELYFVHHTFAEYFAADQIANLLKKDKNDLRYKKIIELLKEEFFKIEREIIVKFIDHILTEYKPILNAIVNNNENLFKNDKFEKYGIDICECDALGRSPIHLAAIYNCNEIINILIKKTEHVNIYDGLDWSPLQYAVRNNNWRIAKLLLEAGSNPSDITKVRNFKSFDKDDGVTLLHFCAMHTTVDIVKNLLERDFKIDICDTKGLTPLFYAIKRNKVDILKYLISMKADVNIADQDGFTPLSYAIKDDNILIIKNLIKSNANINVENKKALDIISQRYNFNIDWYKNI